MCVQRQSQISRKKERSKAKKPKVKLKLFTVRNSPLIASTGRRTYKEKKKPTRKCTL